MKCEECRWYFNGLKCKSRCRECKDFNNFIRKKSKLIRLYDYVEILKDKYICVIDLNGMGLECTTNEIKDRFHNDMITRISTDFSQSASGDILSFIHIDGYCFNDD